jgi:uncharacterized membrane protein YdjX (TVP38/TMEM64 family)
VPVGLTFAGAALTALGARFGLFSPHHADGTLSRILGQIHGLGPLVFIVIQALQVIIAPIPGDFTVLLGGLVLGQWLGFFYSTIGLTIGSSVAFFAGRRFGAPLVRRVLSQRVRDQLDTVPEASGAIFCFVMFLVPGLPKDIACYVFGVTRMSLWSFVAVSTLGRMPGTWLLSAQGAHAAVGDWVGLVVILTAVMVLGAPLYWWRSRIIHWAQQAGDRRRLPKPAERVGEPEGTAP